MWYRKFVMIKKEYYNMKIKFSTVFKSIPMDIVCYKMNIQYSSIFFFYKFHYILWINSNFFSK